MNGQEKWREIPENPRYLVSSLGRVVGIRKKILKQFNDTNGYPMIGLREHRKHGKTITRNVHVLVAQAFIGPRPYLFDVCHLNGIKADNRVENLKYVTHKENMSHMLLHGTMPISVGEDCGGAKLTEKEARYIIENYRFRDKKFNSVQLGKKFGLIPGTIMRIVNGRTWKHIPRKSKIQLDNNS